MRATKGEDRRRKKGSEHTRPNTKTMSVENNKTRRRRRVSKRALGLCLHIISGSEEPKADKCIQEHERTRLESGARTSIHARVMMMMMMHFASTIILHIISKMTASSSIIQ